ncbi:MAG TPA: metal ABC transporter ATP-binding protein [Candidatus Paceibacterota bacterium]|jgi:zinc/manganese transport system ATP-binding protein|nr:metal ABC transporter ATP-binding protein [Candidatus Paceibacterota bacterium]
MNGRHGSSVIVARDLAAGYGNAAVWKDATFSIKKGEFVGILGPNGAGKTTLFRLLLGLAQPERGEIEIFGEKPRRGNARIGYVPQRHAFDQELAIETLEIVRLGACAGTWGFDLPNEVRRERSNALAALKDVGAEHLAHRPLGQLSGGEQQRVFLAQALSGDTEMLLLDEPLANLDIRREGELVQLIADVVRSLGVTALLIAHNINPLLPFLDRVVYAANGRVATGTPEEVLTSETLSSLYNTHVEVLRDSRGRLAIVGAEEGHLHHD